MAQQSICVQLVEQRNKMTTLLDGGMGQELRSRGYNENAKVAGLALLESPDAVREIHGAFIAAGAQVITTWNYAITPQRLARSGNGERLAEMTRTAVDLANEARADAEGVSIAGSLPPLPRGFPFPPFSPFSVPPFSPSSWLR